VEILSGIFEGKTTGTPISLLVWNKDADSSAYDLLRNKPRPGHADYAYQMKYGMRDHRGGAGPRPARRWAASLPEPWPKKLLLEAGIQVVAYVTELGGISAGIASSDLMQLRAQAEANAVRCLGCGCGGEDAGAAGGCAGGGRQPGRNRGHRCQRGAAGLGEPVFDKLDADLARRS